MVVERERKEGLTWLTHRPEKQTHLDPCARVSHVGGRVGRKSVSESGQPFGLNREFMGHMK